MKESKKAASLSYVLMGQFFVLTLCERCNLGRLTLPGITIGLIFDVD